MTLSLTNFRLIILFSSKFTNKLKDRWRYSRLMKTQFKNFYLESLTRLITLTKEENLIFCLKSQRKGFLHLNVDVKKFFSLITILSRFIFDVKTFILVHKPWNLTFLIHSSKKLQCDDLKV